MQISQVSLINHKILQQSLGLFNRNPGILVNHSNILPFVFLLLPSGVQAQNIDNWGERLNNLNPGLFELNRLNTSGEPTNLLFDFKSNQNTNHASYPGHSTVMLFDSLDLLATTNELFDAEGITGGLPKLWLNADDINYNINVEPKFWQYESNSGYPEVQGYTVDKLVENLGSYRSLVIGANLLPREAQQNNSNFRYWPEYLSENVAASEIVATEQPIEVTSINYWNQFGGKSDIFYPEIRFQNTPGTIPVSYLRPEIASTLLIDGFMDSEILFPKVFKDEAFRNIFLKKISVNSVNYQTLIKPEIPYVYDRDDNGKKATIKADTVFKGTVVKQSEISDRQEILPQVNLNHWSGLAPELNLFSNSRSAKISANRSEIDNLTVNAVNLTKNNSRIRVHNNSEIQSKINQKITPKNIEKNWRSWSGLPSEFYSNRQNHPPVNQKSGEKSTSWSTPVVLDQIAVPRLPQNLQRNTRSWSGLPPEFTPANREENTFDSLPNSNLIQSTEASEAKSESTPVELPNASPVALVLPTVPPLSLPISEGVKSEFFSLSSLAPSFPTPAPSLDGEFLHQIQQANNSENDYANNSYTIQAKVLDSPVSDFNYRAFWSEAYSSLINRDLQESLGAIALKTNSTPGVVYVLAADYLELMLLSPGQPIIRRVVHHTNRDLLNATIQELIADVTNPRTLNSDRYLSSAQQLYQWLISPIEEELSARGTDTLIFSLAPNIRSLPLAVLHDGQQFLVEKYRLSLIPSLNTELSYQNLSHSRVLAMGASEFADPKIQPLAQVPLELSAIAQNPPGRVFINEAFTPENLKYQSEGGNYQIVHLATHVEFNPENTQNSYIQFWNRRLTWHEIQQIGWQNQPLELLVMSGCETAFGSPNAELGFAGLAVKNGVKSVLASLWQVNDQGTFGLMSEFYRHLSSQSQTIKAEALRQAQLAMLQGKIQVENGQLTWVDDDPQTYSESLIGEIGLNHQPKNISSQTESNNLSHPYFWAAFTLVGNPW